MLTRSDRAKKAREKNETDKTVENHIEFSKDVFVFVHLMELVEEMTTEIAELRSVVSALSGENDPFQSAEEDEDALPEMFTASKKVYMN